jgi:transposase
VTQYLEGWGREILEGIEELSIDLWNPYKRIGKTLMPPAEIVADRFHVMKQVNEELDRARKKARRAAEKVKDKKQKKKIVEGLTKSKYVLLKNESDLTETEKKKLEEVKEVVPNLGKMHQLKEEFRIIFEESEGWVEGLFNLSDWLKDSAKYFPISGGTIRRWIGEIIAYFDRGTSQGIVEGINNKIKLIKRRAYGLRNFENFRIRSFLTWHFAS